MISREWKGAVTDRVKATAVEAILDMPNAFGVVGAEHVGPLVLQDAAEGLGGDDTFEEKGGQNRGDEGLEYLEDQG